MVGREGKGRRKRDGERMVRKEGVKMEEGVGERIGTSGKRRKRERESKLVFYLVLIVYTQSSCIPHLPHHSLPQHPSSPSPSLFTRCSSFSLGVMHSAQRRSPLTSGCGVCSSGL